MDPVQFADDPQLDAAMAQLNTDMAAEAAPVTPPATPAPESATPAQPAPEPAKETEVQPSKPEAKDGALATEVKQPEKQLSQYAKDQDRRDKSWKAINERKTELEKLETAHKQAVERFNEQKKAFEESQAKASQPKHTPEQFEQHAAMQDKRAEALDAQGQFDEANEARAIAKLARRNAAELRANPPKPLPNAEELAKKSEDEFKAKQKEWWGKAAVDYPAVAKEGSPESEALKALIGANPDILKNPEFMYWGSRLAVAETSAARASTLAKELGDARAKIKELEQKLEITSDGSAPGNLEPVPFDKKTGDEQLADLERQAREIGSL